MDKIERNKLDKIELKKLLRIKEENIKKSYGGLIKIRKIDVAELYATAFKIEEIKKEIIVNEIYNTTLKEINDIIEKEYTNNLKISQIIDMVSFSKELTDTYKFLEKNKFNETINKVYNFFWDNEAYLSASKIAPSPELSKKAFNKYNTTMWDKLF